MSKLFTVSLIIVFLVIGIGIGYVLTPEYSKTEAMSTDLGKADKYYDLRYLNAMIAHHKSAINLATQMKDQTKRSELWDLANKILDDEPKAIKALEDWKKNWYNDTSNVEAGEVPNLGTYSDNFDLRFLNALIEHHEEGVVMAKETMMKSTRNEVLDNASKVEDFLTGGIKTLSDWRTKWYNV